MKKCKLHKKRSYSEENGITKLFNLFQGFCIISMIAFFLHLILDFIAETNSGFFSSLCGLVSVVLNIPLSMFDILIIILNLDIIVIILGIIFSFYKLYIKFKKTSSHF